MIRLFALAMSLGVSACGDGAPEHYYVLCENVDGAGWRIGLTPAQIELFTRCGYARNYLVSPGSSFADRR